MLMAGLLYLGSGMGLGVYYLLKYRVNSATTREATLSQKDLPSLIADGGVNAG